jgi:ArsR family transcriptional regulator
LILIWGTLFERNNIYFTSFVARRGDALDISTNIDIIENMQVNPVVFAKALADDTRQEIMQHLCCVWLNVNDVVEKLDGRVKQPTVSHHLKLLEDAGLVHVRQEGRQRFYSLNQEQLTTCCGMLVRTFAPDYVADIIALDAIG